jgi:hypothetical protein
VNFQVTVLKVLVSYPDGFAAMADLKRDMAILANSGRDWAERTKRLAARVPDLDIFSQGLIERMNGGWRVTDEGRSVLDIMEARPGKRSGDCAAAPESIAVRLGPQLLLLPYPLGALAGVWSPNLETITCAMAASVDSLPGATCSASYLPALEYRSRRTVRPGWTRNHVEFNHRHQHANDGVELSQEKKR